MWNAIWGAAETAIAEIKRFVEMHKNEFVRRFNNQMICDVRQKGDILHVWEPGVCDALVMDWFRRINAGRPTWQHRQKVVGSGRQTIWSTDPVKWEKKVDRLRRLQSNGNNYAEDRRFGYSQLPPPEDPNRQEPLPGLENIKFPMDDGAGFQTADNIWNAVFTARQQNTTDEHLFFALRLSFGSFGHMIGIHLRRGGALAQNIEHNVQPNALHLFDPNVGEFEVPAQAQPPIFLQALLRGVYGEKIKFFSVSHVKVWWKEPVPRSPSPDWEVVPGNASDDWVDLGDD
jgi:hypothetical protein